MPVAVTIVIVCWNSKKYLSRCLAALSKQICRDFGVANSLGARLANGHGLALLLAMEKGPLQSYLLNPRFPRLIGAK